MEQSSLNLDLPAAVYGPGSAEPSPLVRNVRDMLREWLVHNAPKLGPDLEHIAAQFLTANPLVRAELQFVTIFLDARSGWFAARGLVTALVREWHQTEM